MDFLKKLFPLSFKATVKEDLIKAIIIYVVADIVCGIIIGLLSRLPIVGILFGLLGSLVGVYATAGVVLSILVFTKVLK